MQPYKISRSSWRAIITFTLLSCESLFINSACSSSLWSGRFNAVCNSFIMRETVFDLKSMMTFGTPFDSISDSLVM